ncbi:hypothetical protein N7481_012367 [Penicillium waksmanii]|uniref:uncharacterized protein n=1 Tax=Penicillium waksmanii TaxID=69791 RepID=UPI0025489A4F|nr:uncharacterized protein N7481_012367 [Penicillium waksmanii]KAJ5965653.1 hypothetical protein N7481_012367 [Penicillium waksmanii]
MPVAPAPPMPHGAGAGASASAPAPACACAAGAKLAARPQAGLRFPNSKPLRLSLAAAESGDGGKLSEKFIEL